MGLRTIALPVINSVRRNYPPDAGAHIALSKYTASKDLNLYIRLNINIRQCEINK